MIFSIASKGRGCLCWITNKGESQRFLKNMKTKNTWS